MTEQTVTNTHLRAFEAYLFREEKSGATVEKYLRDARSFLRYAEGKPVTKELCIAYKKSLEDAGYKPRSVNSMLVVLNRFLSFIGADACGVLVCNGYQLKLRAFACQYLFGVHRTLVAYAKNTPCLI